MIHSCDTLGCREEEGLAVESDESISVSKSYRGYAPND